MTYHESEWLQVVWEKEIMRYIKSLNRYFTKILAVYWLNAVFDKEGIHHKGERMAKTWNNL